MTSVKNRCIVTADHESWRHKVSQITLRQIPESLDKQLRSLAGKNKTSLNKTILSLLMKNLGISINTDKKRNLTDLHGTWTEDQYNEFKKNTEHFNNIDPEIWE